MYNMIGLQLDQNPPDKNLPKNKLSEKKFDELAVHLCKMFKYSKIVKNMTNKQLKDYVIEKSEFFQKLDIFSLEYSVVAEILERAWMNYYNN